MKIYNLFPLLAGTLDQWGSHIDRAADMGFDWVFVNPIQRPGSSGSLYSVADYFSINPVLLSSENRDTAQTQVRKMAQRASCRGTKLMVDLVINHCAADSMLVRTHADWFVHEANGQVAHPFCVEQGSKVVWRDLARFDHEHTADPEGLYRYFGEHLKAGVGYNFTDFSSDLTDLDYDHQGWFFNIIGTL